MQNAEKFTGKATLYNRYRPGYPAALLDFIRRETGLRPGQAVADVGSGTGLFSRFLLEQGLAVHAVEPNPEMRAQAEAALGAFPRFHSLDGSAEQTGLPAQSVDLIAAAQAFHWFDPGAFARECRRIGKPGAFVCLVWNSRDAKQAIVRENEAVCRRCCPEFAGVSGGMQDKQEAALSRFFQNGQFCSVRIPHPQEMDRAGFIGRGLSSSYAPQKGSPASDAYADALGKLFDRFCMGDVLFYPQVTQCYIGRV